MLKTRTVLIDGFVDVQWVLDYTHIGCGGEIRHSASRDLYICLKCEKAGYALSGWVERVGDTVTEWEITAISEYEKVSY